MYIEYKKTNDSFIVKYGRIICFLGENFMKKMIAVFMLAILLVGCGNSEIVKETDSVLIAPEIKSQETNNTIATVRDYGSKTVVDGFWVQENPDGAGKKFYRYIPLLEKKIPGIYDVEDSEEHKSYDAFRSYE